MSKVVDVRPPKEVTLSGDSDKDVERYVAAKSKCVAIPRELQEQLEGAFPEELILYSMGLIAGQKWSADSADWRTQDGSPPAGAESSRDFWRGVIDARSRFVMVQDSTPASARGRTIHGYPRIIVTAHELLLNRLSEFCQAKGRQVLFDEIQRVIDKAAKSKDHDPQTSLITVTCQGSSARSLLNLVYREANIGRYLPDLEKVMEWESLSERALRTAREASELVDPSQTFENLCNKEE